MWRVDVLHRLLRTDCRRPGIGKELAVSGCGRDALWNPGSHKMWHDKIVTRFAGREAQRRLNPHSLGGRRQPSRANAGVAGPRASTGTEAWAFAKAVLVSDRLSR